MGVLRLYAIGIDEVRSMFGAPPDYAERLRLQAQAALAPRKTEERTGLLSKLGPIFKRVPGTPVLDPDDPTPADVEALVAGAYVPADRLSATWRALETLVRENCWGSTRLRLAIGQLDDLDFALARGQVSAAYGLRHLLNTSAQLSLLPLQGSYVGYHRFEIAVAMADAYRTATEQIAEQSQRDLVSSLVSWLDGFAHWAPVAESLHRPRPDLLGFWNA